MGKTFAEPLPERTAAEAGYDIEVVSEDVRLRYTSCQFTEINELGSRSQWCAIGDAIIFGANRHAKRQYGQNVGWHAVQRLPIEEPTRG